MPASPPLLVLGLDGATFDVIRPLAAAGRLPNLARAMAGGRAAPLPSTTPPMSFPAWSSFLTGEGPGRHGIFDFTQKVRGAYRIRFVNASHRRGDSFLGVASRAGRRVLCLGVPATFPPEPVDGLLVPGFDAPVSVAGDAGSASDPRLYREIAARTGPWMRPDLDETRHDEGWHERALAALHARIERKTAFTLEALRRLAAAGRRPDLAVVVFSESDTVAHHFWRDHDPGSPRHDPRAGALRRGAVASVYERLDAAVGAIRHAFGAEHPCFVLSDHGAGRASRRVVHANRRLADCGLLARRAGPARRLDAAARRARDGALRAVPRRAAQTLFRRLPSPAARLESVARFGGLDWRRTAAFSEEANTQPGVWINLRGREAAGCVAPTDYERVRREVIDALLDWKLPDGEPVVARARAREEVYRGPCVEEAPDVVFELALERGGAHSLVPTPWQEPGRFAVHTLADDELAGGRGRGMNGTHRPDGIWIECGPGAGEGAPPTWIGAVAPTVLATLGVRERPGPHDGAEIGYTAEQEARVAARLRALGYLE